LRLASRYGKIGQQEPLAFALNSGLWVHLSHFFIAAVRQEIHLSGCPNFPGHLSHLWRQMIETSALGAKLEFCRSTNLSAHHVLDSFVPLWHRVPP